MGWERILKEQQEEESEKQRAISVLVVDDDESIITTLKQFISSKNYIAYTAANGKEALELATKACELTNWNNCYWL